MDSPLLTFHHFGLAVRRPETAHLYLSLLGYSLGPAVFDPLQNVQLQMCRHPAHPAVEIISPGETPGPIDKLIERHTNGIVYHLCYETTDLNSALKAFEDAGLRVICVSEPKPALLFNNRLVSFYNVTGMGLIEILE